MAKAKSEVASLRAARGSQDRIEEAHRLVVVRYEEELAEARNEREEEQRQREEEARRKKELEKEATTLRKRLQEAEGERGGQAQLLEGKLGGMDRLVQKLHDEAAQVTCRFASVFGGADSIHGSFTSL